VCTGPSFFPFGARSSEVCFSHSSPKEDPADRFRQRVWTLSFFQCELILFSNRNSFQRPCRLPVSPLSPFRIARSSSHAAFQLCFSLIQPFSPPPRLTTTVSFPACESVFTIPASPPLFFDSPCHPFTIHHFFVRRGLSLYLSLCLPLRAGPCRDPARRRHSPLSGHTFCLVRFPYHFFW